MDKNVKFDRINQIREYEFWVVNQVKLTGVDNTRIVIPAKSWNEANKIFKNLIRLIKKRRVVLR